MKINHFSEHINEEAPGEAVVIKDANIDDYKTAFSDKNSKLIFIFAHGSTEPWISGVETADGDYFTPDDLESLDVGNIEKVIFASCYQTENREKWASFLPEDTDITSWAGEVGLDEILKSTYKIDYPIYSMDFEPPADSSEKTQKE